MQYLALLRGVMPTGPNRIPKMSDLVDFLAESGLHQVSSYIQSGNIICETDMSATALALHIQQLIAQKIGAQLSVIIKEKADVEQALAENPFTDAIYDPSRVHLVFTNHKIAAEKLAKLKEIQFIDEKFEAGSACFYMYLPRNARKKKLNTNFLERHLGIRATMRKLSVVETLQARMLE